MKKSTSRFKKFRFTDLPRLSRRQLPIAATAAAVIVVSCQLVRQGQPQEGTTGKSLVPFMALSAHQEPDPFIKIADPDDPTRNLVELNEAICEESAKEVVWRTRIYSSFGVQQVTFTHPIEMLGSDGASVVAAAGERTLHLSKAITPPRAAVEAACNSHDETDGERPAPGSQELKDIVLALVEMVAPDCEMTGLTVRGWRCRLEAANPLLAKKELEGIQSSMIRRWTRQPYILARRLAVSATLADALASEGEAIEHALDTHCRVVKHSLPVELPLVMRTRAWRQAVCEKPAPDRVAAAHAGLAKAVAEIDLFRQLFERTSKLGYLTIKIPTREAPTRTLWVSLQPEKDVKEGLVEAVSQLWAESFGANKKASTQAEGEIVPPGFCWHPMFGESVEIMDLARYLALGKEIDGVECATDQEARPKAVAYLAESLASETEFVVANGRSKMLRLPQGTYRYTLQGLPEDPSEWDDAANYGPQTAGEVNWSDRRPRPVIDTW